jgi:hypothetical protein
MNGLICAATTAPQWLEAIGTVGTLSATVGLYWHDRFRRRADEVRRQATLISAWTERVEPGAQTRCVTLSNFSDAPVYEVNVFVAPDDYKRDKNTFHQTLLPPRRDTPREVPRRNPDDKGPRHRPRVDLYFTDQNDKRWLRKQNGELDETAERFIDQVRDEGSVGTVP